MLLLITLCLVSTSTPVSPPSLTSSLSDSHSLHPPEINRSLCRALVRHVRPLRILPHSRNRLLVRPRALFRNRFTRLDHLVVRVSASLLLLSVSCRNRIKLERFRDMLAGLCRTGSCDMRRTFTRQIKKSSGAFQFRRSLHAQIATLSRPFSCARGSMESAHENCMY